MDDRTPPKGIKVIGELPYHQPWWDADRLGLQPDWGIVATMALAVVAAIGALTLPEWRTGDPFVLLPALTLGPIGLVLLVSWVASGYPVVISRTELINQSALPLKKPLKISSLYVVGTDRRKLYGMPVAVEIASSAATEKKKTHFVSTMMLTVSVSALSILLTYRIAKAKGENPPPPEFS